MAAKTLLGAGALLRPGLTTAAIDDFVRADTRKRRGLPSQLGYHGFPAAVCTSVNEVVCHGIPSAAVVLRDGDIVNIDVTTEVDGYHGDTSRTFFVGTPSAEASHVVRVAEEARDRGISVVRPGVRLGLVGHTIEQFVISQGCSVVRDYGGHGIGRKMHMPPHVYHHSTEPRGPILREGMTFTVEPMVNLGTPEVRLLDDEWTVVTADGRLSAQFEHTIRVTADGFEVLTRV